MIYLVSYVGLIGLTPVVVHDPELFAEPRLVPGLLVTPCDEEAS